jgi:hypothetical protein
MFTIGPNNTISMTRGDVANLAVTANSDDDSPYTFVPGDIVCLRIMEKNKCNKVLGRKEVSVTESTQSVIITLEPNDTKFCPVINKPAEYWYEVELNPDTAPQTIIGFDDSGGKIFRLYPEGSDEIDG